MKHYLLWIILVIMAPFNLKAQNQWVDRAGELEDEIDAYIAPYLDLDLFSGVLLIAEGDKILVNKGYGMANYEHQVPNTPQTKFRIASLSKLFTKLAIIQLIEQGQLHWEDRLSRFLPDYPHGTSISIKHLVDHRSGIPHLNDFPNYDRLAQWAYSLEELIALFKNNPLDFEPGSQEGYSNSGYILLTYIIEHVSGLRYEAYLHEHIFERAGMEHTGHERYGPVVLNKADGYMPNLEGAGVQRALFINPSIKIGGGSLYATAEDLFLFDQAFRKGQLSRSTEPLYNQGILGSTPGFNAMMWGDGDFFIVALSNNYVPVIRRISRALIDMVWGRAYETVRIGQPVRVTSSLLDQYGGDYRIDDDIISIRRNGEVLIEYENGDVWRSSRLIPLSNDTFFDPWNWEAIIFVKDASGRVIHFLRQGEGDEERAMVAERIIY